MSLMIYELVGKDDIVICPFCWRTRMALAHLGLEYEITTVKLSNKDEILSFSENKLLPILKDGDHLVEDSWKIAQYLERNFVDGPTLLGGEMGTAQCKFINSWTDSFLNVEVMMVIIKDVYLKLDAIDQEIFRNSKEQVLGRTIEEFDAEKEDIIIELRKLLSPLRTTLQEITFLSGEKPAYADYIVYSAFQWIKAVSNVQLLDAGDPLYSWTVEMEDIFNHLRIDRPNFTVSS